MSIIKKTIFLFLLVFPLIFNPFGFFSTELSKIFLLSLSLAIILVMLFYNKSNNYIKAVLNPIILIAAMLAINAIFSVHPLTSLFGEYTDGRFQGLLSIILYLLLFLAVTSAFEEEDVETVCIALILGALISSFYSIFEYLTLLPNWLPKNAVRPSALFGNAVFFGAYVGSIAPLAIAQSFMRRNSSLLNWFYIISYLFLILGLILSGTRSAWLGFIISILFLIMTIAYMAAKRMSRNIDYKFIIIFLLIFISSGLVFSGRIIDRFDNILSVSTGSSLASRFMMWDSSLNSIKDKPLLGSGLDTFGLNYPRYRPENWRSIDPWEYFTTRAHNQFLEMFSTLGIVGSLPLIWLIIAILIKAFKNKRTDLFLINRSLICILITLFTFSFFEFFSVATYVLLFSILGLLTVINYEGKFFNKQRTGSYQLAVLTASLIIFFLISKTFLADLNLKNALSYETQRNYPKALEHYELAMTYDHDEVYSLMYGQTLLKMFIESGDEQLSLKSIEVFNKAKKRNPLDWYVSYDIGKAYLNTGNMTGDKKHYQKAIINYLSALAIDPHYPPTSNELGLAYLKSDDHANAIRYFKRSIKLDPWGVEAYENLAFTYDKMGFKKEEENLQQQIRVINEYSN